MAIKFLAKDAIKFPMRFPRQFQDFLDKKLGELAVNAAAIMRTRAPRDDGDLIASIRASGTHIMAMAGHAIVTEFGSKRKMPKQKRRKGQPKLTREQRWAAKKAWREANSNIVAQPYFFVSVFEAIDRTRR